MADCRILVYFCFNIVILKNLHSFPRKGHFYCVVCMSGWNKTQLFLLTLESQSYSSQSSIWPNLCIYIAMCDTWYIRVCVFLNQVLRTWFELERQCSLSFSWFAQERPSRQEEKEYLSEHNHSYELFSCLSFSKTTHL